jgi:hypothetical protein
LFVFESVLLTNVFVVGLIQDLEHYASECEILHELHTDVADSRPLSTEAIELSDIAHGHILALLFDILHL